MFTDKLFDHKYDIDDLILAFCAKEAQKMCLDTRTGRLNLLTEGQQVVDGSDNNHIHIIESLPPSFLNELLLNSKFKKLPAGTQEQVTSIVHSCHNVHDLTQHFQSGDAGSYIIKSVKAACLDWLDMRNLIPPSMRHTSDMSMFDSFMNTEEKTKVKVSIK